MTKIKGFLLIGLLFTPLVVLSLGGYSAMAQTSTRARPAQTLGILSRQLVDAITFRKLRGEGGVVEQQRRERAEQRRLFQKYAEETYRKPSSKELALLRPTRAAAEAYATFLSQPDTGLIKLIPDHGCGENSHVVSVNDACRKYSMPGHGSAYSFRTKSHRVSRLADLALIDGSFHTPGVWVRGILTSIGDVPIENVSLHSSQLQFLRDHKLSAVYADIIDADREFAAGVKRDGQLYARALSAAANTTYVLRSAAYRGTLYRILGGVVYNEFAYDDREDVLVVFRVVETEPDGSLTIVWRRLLTRQSPTLVIPDKPRPVENRFFGLESNVGR